MRLPLFVLFMAAIAGNLMAQGSYRIGLLPGINLNTPIKGDWRMNFRTESRFFFAEGGQNLPVESGFDFDLSDFAGVISRKVSANQTAGAGYLIRLRSNGVTNHRFIQQYTIVKKYESWRLAHRISTDQTSVPESSWIFRLRYRLAAEWALNGREVDPKEWYLKLNHEYLGSMEGSNADLEIRLVPVLGYAFTDANKVECGLDYRVNNWIQGQPSHVYWLAVSWFVSL
jgi:hypothetical protein